MCGADAAHWRLNLTDFFSRTCFMYCGGCGTPNPEGNNFCKQCGRALIQAKESEPQIAGSKDMDPPEEVRSMPHPATIIIAICSFLVVILLVLLIAQDKTTTKTQQSTAAEAKPTVDDATLHPYDLLKNPYSHKNHIVTLDAESWPTLYNGQLLQYSNGGAGAVSMGYSGLRFKQMLDEQTALYDLMGMEMQGNSDLIFLGQMAIKGSPSGELDVKRPWDVEPRGSLEGSNAMGGTVTVPAVKFWGYTDQRNASQNETQQPSAPAVQVEQHDSAQSPKTAEPPSHGNATESPFRYAYNPNGNLVDEVVELCATTSDGSKGQRQCYPRGWQPWLKELEQRTAGAYADVIARDSDAQGPGNSVISWDDQQRVVFGGFRPHSGNDGIVYFIVAPEQKRWT